MSRNYKIHNPEGRYFITFATIGWIDVFTRPVYKDVLIKSLEWCQAEKGLEIFSWCIMTNHVHLIAKAGKEIELSRIIGSYKAFTSKRMIAEIQNNVQESRHEWMLFLFERFGKYNPNNDKF